MILRLIISILLVAGCTTPAQQPRSAKMMDIVDMRTKYRQFTRSLDGCQEQLEFCRMRGRSMERCKSEHVVCIDAAYAMYEEVSND